MTLKHCFYLAAILLAAISWPAWDWWHVIPPGTTATYVGRESCIKCHAQEYALWQGSDHDLAMDLATPEFVLGDFDDTELEHFGITSRMSRRGDEFFVETEGPDGNRDEFKVKYVFGYRPLQQYLAELEGGHVQVLPVTWDTEEKRWYFANPDEPFGPDDPLHWTGTAQNWNHMCADCHSTNYAKNFDLVDETYHYSFSEMDVSCEACHGPGSIHVELAESKSFFWDRHLGYGLAKLKGKDPTAQLETCAPCHSRRQHIYPGFRPGKDFDDHFSLSLLEEGLYHPDGQIDDEVYVYGSFLQSLMYRKGVRCTDCHDPHSTRVKFTDNRLCTQCHIAAKYDGPVHHHHEVGSEGARCVECHMPEKNYMVVDPRRDHSLRPPRPDLTVKLGIPNACNKCHTKEDETPQWAADWVVKWYGPDRRDDPHYGEIIAAGRRGDPAAIDDLEKLARSANVGPIVRATAALLLGTRYPIEQTREGIERALNSRDAMVRAAAVRAFSNWPITSRVDIDDIRDLLCPRFKDRSRWVREEAARVAINLPPQVLQHFNRDDAEAFQNALEEYETGLKAQNDQPGAHMNLGLLYGALGRRADAIEEYRTAIQLDPAVAGPRSNLARELDSLGEQEEARALREKEAELIRRDTKLLPQNAFLRYQLGLLEYLLGREEQAEASLLAATELEPNSPDFQLALTLLYEKQQRWDKALQGARRLIELQPQNPTYRQILQNIQSKAS